MDIKEVDPIESLNTRVSDLLVEREGLLKQNHRLNSLLMERNIQIDDIRRRINDTVEGSAPASGPAFQHDPGTILINR